MPIRAETKPSGTWLKIQKEMDLGVSEDTIEDWLKIGEHRQELYKEGSTTELAVSNVNDALKLLADKLEAGALMTIDPKRTRIRVLPLH